MVLRRALASLTSVPVFEVAIYLHHLPILPVTFQALVAAYPFRLLVSEDRSMD